MNETRNTFVWYDIMATDTAAIAKFYCDVIGWTAQDSGRPGANYTLFSAGDTMVVGLMETPETQRADGSKPAWSGHIAVDDVDACVEKIVAAGGKIYSEPTDIPGLGRFAVVGDPHGAEFELVQPNGSMPESEAPAPGTPGLVGWHELYAGDLEAAFEFYHQVFGWTKDQAMDMGPMGVYQLFAINGVQSGGMMTKRADAPAPYWIYYFNVEAIDAAMRRVTSGGGSICNGPMQVPGGSWVAECQDPQGAAFAMAALSR